MMYFVVALIWDWIWREKSFISFCTIKLKKTIISIKFLIISRAIHNNKKTFHWMQSKHNMYYTNSFILIEFESNNKRKLNIKKLRFDNTSKSIPCLHWTELEEVLLHIHQIDGFLFVFSWQKKVCNNSSCLLFVIASNPTKSYIVCTGIL